MSRPKLSTYEELCIRGGQKDIFVVLGAYLLTGKWLV